MTQTVLPESSQAAVDIPLGPDSETPAKDKSLSRGTEKLVHIIPLILMLCMVTLWICHKDLDMVSTTTVHGVYHFSTKSTSISERRLIDVTQDSSHEGDVQAAAVQKTTHENGFSFRKQIHRALFSRKDAEKTTKPKYKAILFRST
ncbi:unnamed protein product [Closterium sp. NIES-65]|nr:unnamed protein product [Closterium sp. NIES-65]